MQKRDPVVMQVAGQRMSRLFELARQRTVQQDSESQRLARRYIKIARAIGTHYKVELPKQMKELACKKCNAVLVPGLNCKVRIASSKKYVVYVCGFCSTEKHIFYK
ncbi:MAG: hypothetical protein KGH61_03960 [Candidatus Micrarchaeota archaeon]|nr:hypothetical protein [Candidatus Micrarchaeota archaeon]MDE1848075.1 hypothetical protein [Candidatus Micrarchaeota archaeon]MDE1864870.1 hypothetical protein [Candidatus Micrarchaeota archaeon]